MDTTTLFDQRAENYARFRPSYPAQILRILETRAGLEQQAVIADIGSGTGNLTALFVGRRFRIHGVEPNDEMRAMAEKRLALFKNFISVAGSAEQTSLPDQCIDLVTVAQAFHWFEPVATAAEFQRILHPGGQVLLLWNQPRSTESSFFRALSTLHDIHGLHRPVGRPDKDATIKAFFGGDVEKLVIDNQRFVSWQQFRGTFLSSSWAPRPDADSFADVLADLRRLFDAYAVNGRLLDDPVTELYLARWST